MRDRDQIDVELRQLDGSPAPLPLTERLLSAIANRELRPLEHCASDWAASLTDHELAELGRACRAACDDEPESEADDWRASDLLGVVLQLVGLETGEDEHALPIDELDSLVLTMRVLAALECNRRLGLLELCGPFRITAGADAQIEVAFTPRGFRLAAAGVFGPVNRG